MKLFKALALTTTALFSIASPALATTSSDDPEVLIKDGKIFGVARYRYEHVEQDGFTNDADASTVRTNLGFKTGVYKNFQGLVEAQIVQNIGNEDFNSTTNGKTTFPVVADPDVAEINELWLSWSGLPETTVKVGRQKMNIDNLRFIGTVDWRQNDQTFDAVQITNSSIENLDLLYSYVANVNRIQGGDHPLGDLDSEIHIANVSYKFADWLKLTGYGYWLDFDEAAGLSNKTYGLRATGSVPINADWTFFYEAEGAKQDDHGNNTANYDESYYHISPGIKGLGFTLQAGYEKLGGNGTNSFATPLATLHKFNGWADAFLATPAAGLEDAYISASYQFSGTNSLLDGTKFTAVYHDYDSDASGTGDFGDELDLSIGKSFTLPDAGQPFKKVNVLLKYADYDGDSGIADREKIWVQIAVPF
ncbi:MAG: alginate export family protein [Alphaproteobacteria bacterium]